MSTLLTSTPLFNPLALCMSWTGDLLLTDRRLEKWWDVISEIRLWETVILSYLHSFFLWLFSVCSLWWSKLLCYELPYREAHMAKNWGQHPANSQQGTKALKPTAPEELRALNNYTNAPGSRSSSDWALMWAGAPGNTLQPLWDPEAEDSAKPCPGAWPTEHSEIRNVVLSHQILG